MADLLYEDLTEKVKQAAFEVHSYFGNGYLEKVYENALFHKINELRLDCKQQVPLKVYFEDGVVVGEYFADLLVEGKILIELKTVEKLDKIHFAQLKNYLKTTQLRLGLLINFGKSVLEFKRVIL